MSQQTRLETLEAMKAEIVAEKRDLASRFAALDEESKLLDTMLNHYAAVSEASVVAPDARVTPSRPVVARPNAPLGTSIPNEIMAAFRWCRKRPLLKGH